MATVAFTTKVRSINTYLVILILTSVFYCTEVINLIQLNGLQLVFLDIGQGDATLIITPEGKYGLIDGGRGDRVLGELGKYLPYGFSGFEFVLATHPDADHIGGLIPVLKKYTTKYFFWQKHQKQTPEYAELKRIVGERGLNDYELRDVHDFRLGCCVGFDILWPHQFAQDYEVEDANDISTAILLEYQGFRAFLAGDLAGEFEQQIFSELADPDIDLLKAGHHGSKTSTFSGFLDLSHPEVAVISAGLNNSYGHPAQVVLQNLAKIDAQVCRTDTQGAIKVNFQAGQMNVSSQKGVEYLGLKL